MCPVWTQCTILLLQYATRELPVQNSHYHFPFLYGLIYQLISLRDIYPTHYCLPTSVIVSVQTVTYFPQQTPVSEYVH